jgi:hypothetical protein
MKYYRQFPAAILHLGVRSIVLLTRPPLTIAGPYDLHALATPPALNLSQDQTLQLKSIDPSASHRWAAGRFVFKGSVCLFKPRDLTRGAGLALDSGFWPYLGRSGRLIRRFADILPWPSGGDDQGVHENVNRHGCEPVAS